jgi:hypothetical protein
MEYVEQVDLPGELVDYDEQQAVLKELFAPEKVPLDVIKCVMRTGFLTFKQLLERYEPVLIGCLDEESQALLKILQDGEYLQQVWSWIGDSQGYKQWVHIYIENRDRLTAIADYWRNHPDDRFDFAYLAQEAKNELYLAQTQPGEPRNFDLDGYTGIEDEPDYEYIQVNVPGEGNYSHYLDDPEENCFYELREVTSIPLQQEEQQELKPVEYLNLRFSDVGKMIEQVRRTAVSFRKQNYRLRRDWKRLGLPRKPRYLDESCLEQILKTRLGTGLTVIREKLKKLLQEGIPKQDVLLLLLDGVYIDFLSQEIHLPSGGDTLHEFAQNFADDVLDQAYALQDPPGWVEADEYEYAERLEKEEEFLQIPYDDTQIEYSSIFNRIVIENILQGASIKDAYKRAYHGYKMAQSPLGAYAYRLVRHHGQSHAQAMREYYEAAYAGGDLRRPRDRIINVYTDKITVLTAQSNYQTKRHINGKIAAIKAVQKELYIPKDAPMPLKVQLFAFLKSLHLSAPVIEGVKE